MSKIKVVICEDHSLFREGIRSYLNVREDIECIWEVENGAQLLHRLQYAPHDQFPDLVLLDINMPIMTGLEALPVLKEEYPNLKIVMLTMHNELSMVSTAMKLGANSYVAKNDASDQIVKAIVSVHTSGFYFNDMVNKALYEDMKKKRMTETFKKEEKPTTKDTVIEEVPIVVNNSDTKKKVTRAIIWGVSLSIIVSVLYYFLVKIQQTLPSFDDINI